MRGGSRRPLAFGTSECPACKVKVFPPVKREGGPSPQRNSSPRAPPPPIHPRRAICAPLHVSPVAPHASADINQFPVFATRLGGASTTAAQRGEQDEYKYKEGYQGGSP